jgi:hypothetical protein
MQHHRILSRDEWVPARRRRLSREREITRRRDQSNPERGRNDAGIDFDLTGWACRDDEYKETRKTPVSAERNPTLFSWRAGCLFG